MKTHLTILLALFTLLTRSTVPRLTCPTQEVFQFQPKELILAVVGGPVRVRSEVGRKHGAESVIHHTPAGRPTTGVAAYSNRPTRGLAVQTKPDHPSYRVVCLHVQRQNPRFHGPSFLPVFRTRTSTGPFLSTFSAQRLNTSSTMERSIQTEEIN